MEEGHSLGIRMESTADLKDGQPQCIHHKIVHIHPDGLVREHRVLREGDEILEVSGRVIMGLEHSKAAEIVRATPPKPVKIVVCRPAEEEAEGRMESERGEEEEVDTASTYVFLRMMS